MGNRKPSKGNQVRKRKQQQGRSEYIGRSWEGRDRADEDMLWVHRHVSPKSAEHIRTAVRQIIPHEGIRKEDGYSITIGYPHEMRVALEAARGSCGRTWLARRMRSFLPGSYFAPVDARFVELRQLKQSVVAVVDYPSFAEERFELVNGVAEMLELGDDYEWREAIPHITIAVGGLDKMHNRKHIAEMMPPYIALEAGEPM